MLPSVSWEPTHVAGDMECLHLGLINLESRMIFRIAPKHGYRSSRVMTRMAHHKMRLTH